MYLLTGNESKVGWRRSAGHYPTEIKGPNRIIRKVGSTLYYSDVRLHGNLAGNELLSYIAECASDDISRDLVRAKAYEVKFRDYDWGLNSTS